MGEIDRKTTGEYNIHIKHDPFLSLKTINGDFDMSPGDIR